MSYLRVTIEQFGPEWRNVEANVTRMESLVAARPGADLIVFPELALTGYLLGGAAQDLALPLSSGSPLALEPGGPAVAFGMVELGSDQLVYNTAVLAQGGDVVASHRKIYLPTYGMFDEGRLFARGRQGVRPFDLTPDWRIGLLVCEDLWHPALAYLHAIQEADVIVVLAAPPGRGLPEEGDENEFSSTEPWELLVRSTAFLHGVYVVLACRTGVEASVMFSGGSMVADPTGTVVARAAEMEDARLEVTLDKEAIRRARASFSHLRDEDPNLVQREIQRIASRESAPRDGPDGS
ncbi:MAG: carbon-nitrogen hydrolase [Gemmatimonadota bacterium]|nr:MAG: carbon-nitrogen hydrolase [Gemmatimonadota bacterium]